jgi:hypothetical protein
LAAVTVPCPPLPCHLISTISDILTPPKEFYILIVVQFMVIYQAQCGTLFD